MNIKAIMLEQPLGNMPTQGYRLGEEAEAIEGCHLEGVPGFYIRLNRRRYPAADGFGDWFVPESGVMNIQVDGGPEAPEEKKGKK